jgi:hypothetical protein
LSGPETPAAKEPISHLHLLSGEAVPANRTPETQLNLVTTELRPRITAEAGFASPRKDQPRLPEPELKPRDAELLIHAWSAEVLQSPWAEDRRLLRISLRLPSDQPRLQGVTDLPLKLEFQPGAVRSYRILTQRTVPGADISSAAQHVIWAEITPNGAAGTAGQARTLGSLRVPRGRFTTAAMAPFDGTSLRLIDSGLSAAQAKEETLLDLARLGLTLLLTGRSDSPALSLDLLQELSSGAEGPERSRLLKHLREARALTGMP